MEKFVILGDSCCDLTKELRQKYDVEYIHGHMTLPDGKEVDTVLNWDNIGHDEFYNSLKKNPESYTTAPASMEEYVIKFSEIIAKGYGILSISLSSGLSATYNITVKAKEEVLKKYPDAQIRCIDTLRFGPAIGLMCIVASELRKEGKTLDEVADILDTKKNGLHQMGWLDDLSFVAKKGRMTHAKAFFGTLIGIKPIGEFDYNGMTTVIAKARGEKAAYPAMLGYIEETVIDPKDQIILVAHTDRKKQAETYAAMIKEKFAPKEVLLCEVFAANGVNVGPGLCAAYYFGSEITQGLEKEREIIDRLTQAK